MTATAYHLGQAFLREGRLDDSLSIALSVVEMLERDTRDAMPARLSAIGGLYLTGAIAAARSNERVQTDQLLTRAAALAEQIQDGRNDLWLAFGTANVAVHRVAAAVELGDPSEAVRRGEAFDLSQLPPELLGRRSQLLVELARAYVQRRMDAAAVNTLLEAEGVAPEAIRFNGIVHGVIRELLRREHRRSTPQLRPLAARLGLE